MMFELGRQTRRRIEAWQSALRGQVTKPLMPLDFEGFTTKERLTLDIALSHSRAPYGAGECWGSKWEYGWFFCAVTLPDEASGRRVVLSAGLGGEQLVYLNGKPAGSIDKQHTYVTLTPCAKAGERFELAIESYAGHGPRLENIEPCPPEKPAIPQTPAAQCKVAESCIMLWNETAYQLLMDVEALSSLLSVLPEHSLRAQKVAAALERFTEVADVELPEPARSESFQAAREAIAPELSCRNGSTAPVMSLIGQSHIDLAWLWTLEETRRKSARTYSNQLALMGEYEEYRFLLCEPSLLEMLRQQSPELYEAARQAAAGGQILPEGAFWVECDCNLPCGESLIRQLTRGKDWFSRELGVDSRVAWQPDTFGFSAALPQILRGCGVPYFATQKLLRQDPECQRFPYQNFVWEGIDGSTVLAHVYFKANAQVSAAELCRRWEQDRVQQRDIDGMLYPFGFGDGGGGATRDMLEQARRLHDLEGAPRTRYEGLREFFERLNEKPPNNRWVGELYLAWHRGAYTAQRRTKALCRRLEYALRETETLLARRFDSEGAHVADEAWQTLLLCQFHDVLGGVGIRRVHEEANGRLIEALDELDALKRRLCAALYNIVPEAGAMTVYNPLPWARAEWTRLPDGGWAYVQAPAMGAQSLSAEQSCPDKASIVQDADGILMENGLLSLRLDKCGCVTSLVTKPDGRELVRAGGRMNDWRLYQDVNPDYDAWELARDWRKRRVGEGFSCEISVSPCGGSVAEATIIRAFGHSRAVQKIRVYAGSRRVDFDTQIDWHERHRLLKAHFESGVLSEDMLNEIQFGYVRRPAHSSHAFAADRYEVCQHRFSALCEVSGGFALLNDGLYGISADRGELALTLLRAPLVPDDSCDRGEHRFTYALYPFAGRFADSGATREAIQLNQPLTLFEGRCRPLDGFSIHGSAVLETVKPSPDGLTLRLYESLGIRGESLLSLPFDADVYELDMRELQAGTMLGSGRELRLRFRPFEVKTLRVSRNCDTAD